MEEKRGLQRLRALEAELLNVDDGLGESVGPGLQGGGDPSDSVDHQILGSGSESKAPMKCGFGALLLANAHAMTLQRADLRRRIDTERHALAEGRVRVHQMDCRRQVLSQEEWLKAYNRELENVLETAVARSTVKSTDSLDVSSESVDSTRDGVARDDVGHSQ